MDHHDINHRFAFHPATTVEAREAHEFVRNHCADVAHDFINLLPEGREKSVAITKLEEAMFWANASIARNGGPKS